MSRGSQRRGSPRGCRRGNAMGEKRRGGEKTTDCEQEARGNDTEGLWGSVGKGFTKKMRRVARAAEDLLYPRRCPLCDRPVRPFGSLICRECEKLPVRVTGSTCRRCGKALADPAAEYCGDCLRTRHVFESGGAVFEYHSIQGAIYRFKYDGRAEYADWFGREMAEKLCTMMRQERWRADALIPVPLYEKRRKERGYNQAALLAQQVSRRTGIPVREDILVRVRATAPMKNKSLDDRRISLQGAFFACSVEDNRKSFIIVDDIFTTGATVDACAEALYHAGAVSVHFLTLAVGGAG